MANIRTLIVAGAAVLCGFSAFAEDIEITVEAGQTVTRDDVISGEGKLVKKGAGTLILTAANTYTGGTELQAGVIEIRNKDALGTDPVTITGSDSELHQLKFNVSASAAAVPNAITLEGSSSAAYPALCFATNTTLSGAITANGDLYFAETGYAQNPSAKETAYVKLNGAVTVGSGFRISGAPNCMVSFGGVLTTPMLEDTNAGPGNGGSYELTKGANSIGRIKLKQANIKCSAKNVCTNTVLDWTDAVLRDDVARFDMGGNEQDVFDILTPVIAKGGEGCVITNKPSNTRSFYIRRAEVARDCYARFDGYITINYNCVGGKRAMKFTLKNRRHLMRGQISSSQTGLTIGEGTSFPFASSLSAANGSSNYVDSREPDVFDSVSSISTASCSFYFNTEESVVSFSRNHKASILASSTATYLYISGTKPLEAKYFQYAVKVGDKTYKYGHLAGAYAKTATTNCTADSHVQTGMVLAWGDKDDGTRTNWTEMVWSGASTASTDINDFANWQPLKKFATFLVPCGWVKFAAGGSEATLANDVNWGGLTFKDGSSGFTLAKGADADPTIHLYDHPITFETKTDTTVQRTFTIEPQLDLHVVQTWAVPANDKLVISAGIVTNEFVVDAANAGTIALGGTIPAKLVVNAGKLEIASGATLPSKFTEISLGANAQLDVKCTAGEMTVDSLKIGGTEAIDGDYTFGNLIIKQRKYTVPEEPTATATWVGGGDNDSLATAANWKGGNAPKFDAGLKMILSESGTTATVPNGTMAHSIVITNATDDTASSFTLHGGAENAADTVLKLYGKMSVNFPSIVTFKDITVESANGVDEGEAAYGAANTISVLVTDKPSSRYTLILDNAVVSKPIAIRPLESQASIKALANTTNEIKAQVKKDGGGNWFTTYVDTGSRLIFSGGVSPVKGTLKNYGEIIITNKPWRSTSDGDGICSVEGYEGGRVRYAVASNYFGNGTSGQNGLRLTNSDDKGMFVDFEVSDAIYGSRLNFTMAAKASYNNRSITVDFHCTTQRIIGTYATNVDIDKGNGTYKLTGEKGSLLIVDNVINAAYSSTNVMCVAGGLSIEKRGDGLLKMSKLAKVERNDATTTGQLTVKGGTVEMDAGCSWCNGPVSVSGGTLKIAEANQLGREQKLMISTDENSKLDIADGVTLTMSEVYLGDTQVIPGTYQTGGEEAICSHLSGNGTLRVAAGTMFIIK